MKSPTLPAPAIATRISLLLRPRCGPAARRWRSTSDTNTSTSPSWPTMSVVTICAFPKRVTAVSQKRPGRLSSASFLPTALGGIWRSMSPTLTGGVDPVAARLGREQAAQHLVGGPRDGRDGRDAEPLVDQRAPRVVDAGDDVLDAVGLAGDPGAQDVGVVAARDRRERLGLGDAGRLEVVAVEPEADHGGAGEVRRQAAERPGVLVDDRDGVIRSARGRRPTRCPPGRSR